MPRITKFKIKIKADDFSKYGEGEEFGELESLLEPGLGEGNVSV